MFGRTVSGFGSKAKRGTPFAVSIITDGSAALTDIVEHAVPAGSGSFVTGTGGVPTFDISVSATGGSGSYTFTWTNSEADDPQGVYSVNSVGTTNAAQYNTLTLNGTVPASASDPPNDCVYQLSCRVQDGAGGDITVTRNLAFVAIGL